MPTASLAARPNHQLALPLEGHHATEESAEVPEPRAFPTSPPAAIGVGGRTLHPSPVFDTYWRFAAERQAVYRKRLAGLAGP